VCETAVRQGDVQPTPHLGGSLRPPCSIALADRRLALLYQAVQLLREPLLLLQDCSAVLGTVRQVSH
jgi:hypothetical protein